MYLVNKAQMKEIEAEAMDKWEIPSLILMENAGHAIVNELKTIYTDLVDRRITLIAGSGNNGGDALVAARLLQRAGVNVVVFVINNGNKVSEEHEVNRRILTHSSVRIFEIKSKQQTKILKAHLKHSDLILDGLFGIGLNRNLNSFYQDIIDIVNEAEVDLIAIDVPSGLDADTGKPFGAAMMAKNTFSLACGKTGLYATEAKKWTGKIHILDIGIPREIINNVSSKIELLTPDYLGKIFNKREDDCHKYHFGHLAIIGGSIGMSGAVILSGLGALRSGVGLVSAIVEKGIYQGISASLPEAMVKPVNWEETERLESLIEKATVFLIGPGFGLSEKKESVVRYFLENGEKPLVLDADGLSLASRIGMEKLKTYNGPVVLTPHPGEAARFYQKSSQEVQDIRIETAISLANDSNGVVILKGYRTVIAAPDGRLAINTVNSAALATAGSGDVLAGIVAALLANGMDPFQAACASVLLHGLAGHQVESNWGTAAPLASDIANSVGLVLKTYI